jgi:hypothetical protein
MPPRLAAFALHICILITINPKNFYMKKLLTLVLAFSIGVFQQASAQLKKGEVMLGGTLSANFSESDGSNTVIHDRTTIAVMPQLGFGVGGNWIIGFGIGFTHTRLDAEGLFAGGPAHKSNIISGGIFARKSHQIGGQFGIFGQADASYGAGKTEQASGSQIQESKITTLNFSLSPGAYFRASRRFIIETSIGGIEYAQTRSRLEGGGESRDRVFDITLASSLSLGFRVVL